MTGASPTARWASPCCCSFRWCCSRFHGARSPRATPTTRRGRSSPERAGNGRCARPCEPASTGALAQVVLLHLDRACTRIVVQLVAFLIDAGYSPLGAASTFGVIGMLSSISIMGSGYIADRFGFRRTVTASFIGTGSGMLLLMAITRWPSELLLAALRAGVRPVHGHARPDHLVDLRAPFRRPEAWRRSTAPSTPPMRWAPRSARCMGGVLHDLTRRLRGRSVLLAVFSSRLPRCRSGWCRR